MLTLRLRLENMYSFRKVRLKVYKYENKISDVNEKEINENNITKMFSVVYFKFV